MSNESEPESRIRVSQWVTRRWGCLLLWVQGKFSCIALGKLEKWGWGRKKSLRVGTDERTGERVKLVGRRSPKDRDHRGELPGKAERQRSLGTRLIDMKGSLWSLYDLILSANAFVFKAPQPTLDEEECAPCSRVWTGESTGRSSKGLNVGGANPEKRSSVGREKAKEPSGGGATVLSCCALSHFCRTWESHDKVWECVRLLSPNANKAAPAAYPTPPWITDSRDWAKDAARC